MTLYRELSDRISPPTTMIVYRGRSMNPTLREPDVLDIIPRNISALRRGDVIAFRPKKLDLIVIHRVVDVSETGIRTKGDRWNGADRHVVQAEEVLGLVQSAWRGNRSRLIVGGRAGRIRARLLQARRIIDKPFVSMIKYFAKYIQFEGILAKLWPEKRRLSVAVFGNDERIVLRLILDRRAIGWLDARRAEQWRIAPLFRPFIDLQLLSRAQVWMNGRRADSPAPFLRSESSDG